MYFKLCGLSSTIKRSFLSFVALGSDSLPASITLTQVHTHTHWHTDLDTLCFCSRRARAHGRVCVWICNAFRSNLFFGTLTGTRCCGFLQCYDTNTSTGIGAHTCTWHRRGPNERKTLTCNGESEPPHVLRLLLYRKMEWMVGFGWMVHAITQTEEKNCTHKHTHTHT